MTTAIFFWTTVVHFRSIIIKITVVGTALSGFIYYFFFEISYGFYYVCAGAKAQDESLCPFEFQD